MSIKCNAILESLKDDDKLLVIPNFLKLQFLRENKELCPRFNVCIKRIFKEMQERVNQGDTICDLGRDYEEEFKSILKLKANSKTN